ncbi:MAG: hypothetical protein Q9228_003165 [Teloschistes exilis]
MANNLYNVLAQMCSKQMGDGGHINGPPSPPGPPRTSTVATYDYHYHYHLSRGSLHPQPPMHSASVQDFKRSHGVAGMTDRADRSKFRNQLKIPSFATIWTSRPHIHTPATSWLVRVLAIALEPHVGVRSLIPVALGGARTLNHTRSIAEIAGTRSPSGALAKKTSSISQEGPKGTRRIRKILSSWWAKSPSVMALVVPPPNDKKRVKVYELRNNDWFDRGTGFCTGRSQGTNGEDSRIFVESEDKPERMLLETRITREDGYQKQQDTLIVWTESSGTDMALSFQEAEGCAAIWSFVSQAQQHLVAVSGPDDALSDDAMDTFSNPLTLPRPELSNLDEIVSLMRTVISTPQGRDSLSKLVITEDYIRKLVPLVEMAEDLESLEDLHHLCNIMKMLVLLNDTQIIELAVSDDMVMGVVGALEYDPDFPTHKANHRRYLKDRSKYKEVVPIQDLAIKKKIHSTWRLLYLKDVVLARILDDPTFSVLNSLIFFNQVDIVSHLQGNNEFLEELFGIINDKNAPHRRKKDAVAFIQNCCVVAKNLQTPGRATLYNNFIQSGLLHVINFALLNADSSIRVAGTDILVSLIDHDATMVRMYIFRALHDQKRPLTDTLIELLLIETDLGVKAQAADAIKVLLEPQQPTPPPTEAAARTNAEFLSKLRGMAGATPQTEPFIQSFYDNSAKRLFKPLKDLERRTTPALKFFRTCIGLNDEYYIQQMTTNFLFEPILNVVYATMPRDNLLNSVCLELFEFIKRENIRPVIVHVVENYRAKLEAIDYVDTFQNLVLRYEQQMQGYNSGDDPTLFSQNPDGTPNRGTVNGNNRWQGVKEMDAAEEAYFNEEDEEDELASKGVATKKPAMVNGAPTLARSLVDYPDDDEEPMDVDKQVKEGKADRASVPSVDEGSRSRLPVPSTPPPEKLSEKRRREEDEEEDELGKLSTSKRRSSSVSSSNSDISLSSSSGNVLRRKKAFSASNHKDSTGSHDKIKISLSSKAGSETDSKRDEGG